MRWLHSEYLSKGLCLGLLLFTALQEAASPVTGWPAVSRVTLLALGGLTAALAIAAVLKLREGCRVKGRPVAFLVFLLLESPTLVYAGIILGLAAGAYTLLVNEEDTHLVLATLGGGLLLGLLFGMLPLIRRRTARLGLSLALAAALVIGALAWFGQLEHLGVLLAIRNPLADGADLTVFAVQLLVGLPLFYVLTFSGQHEETEVEIGALCAALGLGLAMLSHDANRMIRPLAFLLPLLLYVVYTVRILPALRVFKHALRGFRYLDMGRYRNALACFRRALQLDPNNPLARDGYWRVHCALDLAHLSDDPQTLALVDFDLCLDRAGALLIDAGPTPQQLQEAQRLLNLVLAQRPGLWAPVSYWRAVACTHARDLDQAAAELTQVLDVTHSGFDDPARQAILVTAWQLALLLHDELRRRVGQPQLARPGQRMEAIAAVERHLAGQPEDALAWSLKRMLYQDVTETDYEAAAPGAGRPVPYFDHAYVQQLGLAMINDSSRWQRGGEYLRLAARGLAALGPTLFVQVAQAQQRAGDLEAAWHSYESAKRAGVSVGPRNLGEQERQAFFATVKVLGDAALAHNEIDLAIENYQLYSESDRSGVETLRTLADLYERKGDALAALRVTEQALVYSPKQADLLQRKDRYYYSVMPDFFRAHPDAVPGGFDVAYCLSKARSLLNAREIDLDTLDWAQHLADLVFAVKPDNIQARMLLARAWLRRGEKDNAVAVLEDLHTNRPSKFGSDEEEEAWFQVCRLLGDLYLQDLNRPDLAVPCYSAYRKSAKSGADTLYKLGQAFESLGDKPRAVKFYEQVTSYADHPLAPQARDALYRLKNS